MVYREVEATLKRDAATGAFVAESFSALIDRTMIPAEEQPNEGQAAKQRETIQNRTLWVKLTHYQSKVFAKISTEIRSIPEGDFVIRAEGVYEMKLLEGRWGDYERGGVMKLALSKLDAERYAEDRLIAHREARFRDWNLTHFREKTLAQFDRQPGPPDFLSNFQRSQVEKMKIHMIPEYREKGGVFVCEGETVRFTAEEVATSIGVGGAVPLEQPIRVEIAGDGLPAPPAGPKPFNPAMHAGEREKSIYEVLPKTRWPGW